MIKSLLQFNNPDNLTKDEVKGVSWTVNGTVASSQDGKFNNCLSMNGNGYLQNNTIDLSLDKDWTLDMWVYVYSSGYFSPFSIASSASKKGILVESDQIFFGLQNGTWYYTTFNIPKGRWTHIAMVNSASTLYAFLDGVKVIKRTNQDVVLSTTPEILIGLNRTIFSNFYGLVDEFRISDRALWTSDFTPPTHEVILAKYLYIDKNNIVMGMKE